MELNKIENEGKWSEQTTRLNSNFNKINQETESLKSTYKALTQSDVLVVSTLPQQGVANTIYRVVGNGSYSDYMYNSDDLTTPILMATYNNAIDTYPQEGSENLITSGAVYESYANQVYLDNQGEASIPDFTPQSDSVWSHGVQEISAANQKQVRANLGFGDGDIDEVPTSNSRRVVRSGGVKSAIDALQNNVTDEIEDFKNVIRTQISEYEPIVIEGDVTNAPDEEDLTSSNGLLKLKNRNSLYGMGKIILRRNQTFAVQLTQTNTIYIIQYDFDLNGATVAIPKNCVLQFEGGSLSNGELIFLDTEIKGCNNCFRNITFEGKIVNTIFFANWFNIIPTDNLPEYVWSIITQCIDITNELQNTLNNIYNCGGGTIIFYPGVYSFSNIVIPKNISIKGQGKNITVLHQIDDSEGVFIDFENVSTCGIYDLTIRTNPNNTNLTTGIRLGIADDYTIEGVTTHIAMNNCDVSNFSDIGVDCKLRYWNFELNGINIFNCGNIGMKLNCTDCTFSNIFISGGIYNIYASKGGNNKLVNIKCDQSGYSLLEELKQYLKNEGYNTIAEYKVAYDNNQVPQSVIEEANNLDNNLANSYSIYMDDVGVMLMCNIETQGGKGNGYYFNNCKNININNCISNGECFGLYSTRHNFIFKNCTNVKADISITNPTGTIANPYVFVNTCTLTDIQINNLSADDSIKIFEVLGNRDTCKIKDLTKSTSIINHITDLTPTDVASVSVTDITKSRKSKREIQYSTKENKTSGRVTFIPSYSLLKGSLVGIYFKIKADNISTCNVNFTIFNTNGYRTLFYKSIASNEDYVEFFAYYNATTDINIMAALFFDTFTDSTIKSLTIKDLEIFVVNDYNYINIGDIKTNQLYKSFVYYNGLKEPKDVINEIIDANNCVPIYGNTSEINTLCGINPIIGFEYFDTTLNKPIYWNGTDWVDALGNPVE